jgi:hypothetical protein
MEVSPETYDEVLRNILRAGYDQAVHEGSDGQVIDMHGTALSRGPEQVRYAEFRQAERKHEHVWQKQPGLIQFETDDGRRCTKVRSEIEVCATCPATRVVSGTIGR